MSLKDPKIRQQLTRLLAKTLIFADTLEAFRKEVTEHLKPISYRSGQVVFRHGEPGSWLGILLTWRLERRLERMAAEISIGEIGPGGIIGDLGLFGVSHLRSFTVMAVSDCEILALSQQAFEESVRMAGGPMCHNFVKEAQRMTNLMADAESFVNLQCFKKLDRDFVMTLRENSEPRLCYRNQVLMKEGHYGDEMYILRAGTVKIEKNNKFVVELPSGVVLGELAVLGSDKRRTATVTCTSLCLIRALHADVFHEILEKFPHAKRSFDHAYVARLVSVEVHNAKDELQTLDAFYGSATPRTGTQLQNMLGPALGEECGPRSKHLTPATPRSKGNTQNKHLGALQLPKVPDAVNRTPRGVSPHPGSAQAEHQ
jgi:CRP-like cAMP-binding protein